MGIDYFEAVCKHKGFHDGTFAPSVQTNGVKLDENWIYFFRQNGFSIGLSFDGYEEVQNKNRPFVGGRGSYRHVIRAIKKLNDADCKFGVLCVIDPFAEGARTYDHFKSLNIKSVDLLFPIACWDDNFVDKDYIKRISHFVKMFFLCWIRDKNRMKVRLFNSFFHRAMGKEIEFGSLGYSRRDIFYAVLETDGYLHFEEDLNMRKFRESSIGFSPISLSEFTEFEELEEIFSSHTNSTDMVAIPNDCRQCSVQGICLSGHPSSRFSSDRGFDNRSINCQSLFWLGSTVSRLLSRETAFEASIE